MTSRQQSLGEEIANSVTHGMALLLAIVAAPFLIASAGHLGISNIVGACIFALTMILLYLTSTLYHFLPEGHAKCAFLKLDNSAIYLFIAGSYTPFALSAANGLGEWTLFGLVWLLAFAGAALKAMDRLSHPWLSTGLYVAMGWLVLIAAIPLIKHLPREGTVLLVAGGLAYTTGVVFFILDSRIRYSHTVWHCFVVSGTGCHLFAMLSCTK